MNRKIKLYSLMVILLATLVGIASISCINKSEVSTKQKRELLAYSRCSSEEISSDILYSVDQIKKQLSKRNIYLKVDAKKRMCGYMLVNGKRTRTIKGALTDIELLEEVNKFFK